MPGIKTFAFEARGVGRKDYSSGIEYSVEPLIMSYQEEYSEWQTVTVPAGADLVVDIVIPGGHVAIVYDFFASITQMVLLGLKVDAVSGVVVAPVLTKEGYGTQEVHLPKGVAFFQIIRFTVHNFYTDPLDVNIGAVGIYTDEEHYYLRVGLP